MEVLVPIHGTNSGETLRIVQTGGEKTDEIIEVIDDPLVHFGEEYLIFARVNESGRLTILGGPQGHLVHNKGKLSSLSVVDKQVRDANAFSNIQINQMELEDLIHEIQLAIG